MTTATEHQGAVTLKGNPKTLLGDIPAVGQPAPDFVATANDLSDTRLSDYRGKVVILSSVPSLDTPVCDIQTKRFNEDAGQLGDGAVVLTISTDTPFAQKRWCGAADATNVVTLSDFNHRGFSEAFGLRVKEIGFLARAVFVIDQEGTISHAELVKEIAEQPDYDAALEAAKALL